MEGCWICFQDEGELIQPCKCPRTVHRRCLASWQLYSAGTREEVECRFCSTRLPDWRSALHPQSTVTAPVVAVVYEGQEYRFRVEPTKEGQAQFKKEVEKLLGHPIELHEVKFYCRGPAGNDLQLRGLESLDAAVHCAAATATDRAAQLEAIRTAAALTAQSSYQRAISRSAAAAGISASSSQQESSSSTEGDQDSSSSSASMSSGASIHDRQQQHLSVLPPGMDIYHYWAALHGIDVRNVQTSSGSEAIAHDIAARAVAVSAAQRWSEMAAAWAYLSSQAAVYSAADATAHVRVVPSAAQAITAAQAAEPSAAPAAAAPVPENNDADGDVATAETGNCLINWLASLLSVVQCLCPLRAAADTVSNRASTLHR